MSHPYYHAKSSIKKYPEAGNIPFDRLIQFHSWFDQTKCTTVQPQHRLFLHNTWGIYLAKLVFSDIPQELVRVLGEQHVYEDLGVVLKKEWVSAQLKPLFTGVKRLPEVVLENAMMRYMQHVSPKDIQDIVMLLYDVDNPELMWHSYSPFIVEQIYGTMLSPVMPTRVFVESILKHILRQSAPDMAYVFQTIPYQSWMNKNAKELSKEFIDE